MQQSLTQLDMERMEAEEALERKQWTPESFLRAFREYCNEYDYTAVEGLVEFAKDHELGVEFISQELMSEKLYAMLQDDAEERKLISKSRRIQFSD